MKKKSNNKTALLDNKNKEIIKKQKNNYKINKYEKFLTNMNEIKNKYYSNYYDYFLKSKNFNNTLTKIVLDINFKLVVALIKKVIEVGHYLIIKIIICHKKYQ